MLSNPPSRSFPARRSSTITVRKLCASYLHRPRSDLSNPRHRHHRLRPRWYHQPHHANRHQRRSQHLHLVLSNISRHHWETSRTTYHYSMGLAYIVVWSRRVMRSWVSLLLPFGRTKYITHHRSFIPHRGVFSNAADGNTQAGVATVVLVWIFLGCFNFSNPILYSCAC